MHKQIVLITQMYLLIISSNLAGRLFYYAQNWAVIIQDRWVLQATIGYQLELTQTLHQVK